MNCVTAKVTVSGKERALTTLLCERVKGDNLKMKFLGALSLHFYVDRRDIEHSFRMQIARNPQSRATTHFVESTKSITLHTSYKSRLGRDRNKHK